MSTMAVLDISAGIISISDAISIVLLCSQSEMFVSDCFILSRSGFAKASITQTTCSEGKRTNSVVFDITYSLASKGVFGYVKHYDFESLSLPGNHSAGS